MLTSFFGKSNPINYLLAGLFICLAYITLAIYRLEGGITLEWVGMHLFRMAILVFSMLLLDFIIRKNGLTRPNTYGIFFFACFIVCLPELFMETEILVANLFVFLALRRIFSLQSGYNTEKKILDAALWITVASFFYFWSLLLFPALFFAVMVREGFRFKQLFIPVIGFLTVLVLITTIYVLVNDSFDWYTKWPQSIGYDFTLYGKTHVWLPVTLFATLAVWTGTAGFIHARGLTKKNKPAKYLLLLTLGCCILVSMTAANKTGAELLFLLGPLGITSGNYIERLEEFWFREILLWLVLLLSIGLMVALFV